MATHLATVLLWVILLPEKLKKTCSSWSVFIIFCIKIALRGPHGIIFAPLPKVLEKKRTISFLYLYVHFPRVFVEFVVLLTKIWPKILIFSVTAKCWRETVQRTVFIAPPSPFHTKK